MIVIAGPAGSGKSTAFPVAESGVDAFNIDDRAAELNGSSYSDIPPELRARAIHECEAFIESHIRQARSFAVETTLRTDITFRQATAARDRGFSLQMRYVCVDEAETNIERIANRADAGGHATTPARIREIREASLRNFTTALRLFNRVRAYDNTRWAGRPHLVFEARGGRTHYIAEDPPSWLVDSLRGTEFDTG